MTTTVVPVPLTGVRKAATLTLLLGEESISQVFKYLNEDEEVRAALRTLPARRRLGSVSAGSPSRSRPAIRATSFVAAESSALVCRASRWSSEPSRDSIFPSRSEISCWKC